MANAVVGSVAANCSAARESTLPRCCPVRNSLARAAVWTGVMVPSFIKYKPSAPATPKRPTSPACTNSVTLWPDHSPNKASIAMSREAASGNSRTRAMATSTPKPAKGRNVALM